MEQDFPILMQAIKHTLDSGRPSELVELLSSAHPADVAEAIAELGEKDGVAVLSLLDPERGAAVLQEMDYEDQLILLRGLDRDRASDLLEEMSHDDIADFLAEIPEQEVASILELMEAEDAQGVQGLMDYPEDTAGGLMNPAHVSLPDHFTTDEAIRRLRELSPDAETAYYIFVTDQHSKLVGIVSLRDLLVSAPDQKLRSIMDPKVIRVDVNTDQEEVARLVARYDLLAVPVVDPDGRLLGIVTVDDVIDVIEEEASEDIYRGVGASLGDESNLVDATVSRVARLRLPWLLVTLAAGFVSASIIRHFTGVLETVVVLAYFIPVIMAMGGNVGTQSSTFLVRAIATGEVNQRNVVGYILRETRVGLAMGLVMGILISLGAWLWQGQPFLGVVVGSAMFSAVAVGAMVGTAIPLAFLRLGIDPAFATGPFVSTINDSTGLLIYFASALTMMRFLSS